MLSCFTRITKKFNIRIPFRINIPEFQALGDGIRLGELKGVDNQAIDGCIVCTSALGPNPYLPEWYNLWLKYHDIYDEIAPPPGTMISKCPIGMGYTKRCGKYCCTDVKMSI